MFKFTIRSLLILSTIISVVVIVFVLFVLGVKNPETWAVIAASLAVLTSVISSWSAQRVLEIEEDSQKPYCYPSIDIRSRYGLMQLRVTNYGGSVAREIYLHWDKPLLNSKSDVVKFTKQEGTPDIPILLPNESVSVLIDGTLSMFQRVQDMNYSGRINFKNASGKKIKYPFYVSAEIHRSSLSYDEEESRTHFELQKIPKELQKIGSDITRIQQHIQSSVIDRNNE